MPFTGRSTPEDTIRYLTDLYTMLLQVNRAIRQAGTVEELFWETVRVCADSGRFDLAWVGVPEARASAVKVMAAHGPAADYLDGIQVSTDATRPEGLGPTGSALREGRRTVVQDWARNATTKPWQARAATFALRSSAAFPVCEEDGPVAVLTLYSREVGYFQPERLVLLDELARDLGAALVRLRQERYRRLAEAELEASEARFHTAFDRAIVAKSLSSVDGTLLQVNDAYCQMLGYTREEMETTNFLELTHPDDRAPTSAFIQWLKEGTGVAYRMEKRYLHKDGHLVWGDMNTVLLRDAAGRPRQFITDIVDITARKGLELELQALNQELEQRVLERTRQLASANEALEAFTYSIAHDLRAPLRSLTGFSELLTRSAATGADPARLDYLGQIRDAAQRMGLLIDDLLRLSHVGEGELGFENLDLAALAREVFTQDQEREPRRCVTLRVEEPLPAQGDPRLLRVLLDNLIGNAWKFTAKNPGARLEVGREAGLQAYYVKDNGVGFPMAQAGRLFTPFQRLHAAEEFPGTGIGLALARRIVGRHGGRIWVQSEPEVGTTVYFTLQPRPGP